MLLKHRNSDDLIPLGIPFIANPDLVEYLRRNAPLNALDADTLYACNAHGYTDYPILDTTD